MPYLRWSFALISVFTVACSPQARDSIGSTTATSGQIEFSAPANNPNGKPWAWPDATTLAASRERLATVGPARLSTVRSDHWENPSITVYADRIRLQARTPESGAAVDAWLALQDLPEELASLPKAAWPYGGWVELAPIALGASADLEEAARRSDEVEKVLAELGLRVNMPGLG